MKNKGFTLVELLGVLTLIGVIAIIAIPAVDSVVKRARQNMYERSKQTVITSTRSWLSDNKELFYKNGDKITLTILDLKEQGYLDFEFRNPTTSTCVSNTTQIQVTKVKDETHNTFKIELVDELLDGTEEDCEAVSKAPSLYLTGENPLEVKLGKTLTTDELKKDIIAKSFDDQTDLKSNVYIGGDTINTKIPGEYRITYSVTNNSVTKTIGRTIKVIDDEPPVITGADGDLYFDKTVTGSDLTIGVTVTDNSKETIAIEIRGDQVKYGTPGTYRITYFAIDSSGNSAAVERKVIIQK